MSQATLNVPDISCEACEATITKVLTPVDGVRAVSVDIPAKQVTIDYDDSKVSVDRVQEILEDEDYPVASVG
jgi:copper chaperone CopZ